MTQELERALAWAIEERLRRIMLLAIEDDHCRKTVGKKLAELDSIIVEIKAAL